MINVNVVFNNKISRSIMSYNASGNYFFFPITTKRKLVMESSSFVLALISALNYRGHSGVQSLDYFMQGMHNLLEPHFRPTNRQYTITIWIVLFSGFPWEAFGSKALCYDFNCQMTLKRLIRCFKNFVSEKPQSNLK